MIHHKSSKLQTQKYKIKEKLMILPIKSFKIRALNKQWLYK